MTIQPQYEEQASPQPQYEYVRKDGRVVKCYGDISDTPQLQLVIKQPYHHPRTIYVSMQKVFVDGNTLKTWRSWCKWLAKYSQFANDIIEIKANKTNGRATLPNSEK